MSRKSSSVYEKSSFDAVESTRRLSEEIKGNASSMVPKDQVIIGPLNESSTAEFTDIYKNGIHETVEIEIEDRDYHLMHSNDNDNNNNFKKAQIENETLRLFTEHSSEVENADVTAKFIRFDMSSESKRRRNSDAITMDCDYPNDVKDSDKTIGKSNLEHGNMFEQRSESDSDLDSADDFSDGEFCHKSKELIINEKDSSKIENHESQRYDGHASFPETGEDHLIIQQNCQPLESKSSEIPPLVNEVTTRTPDDKANNQHALEAGEEYMDAYEQLESSTTKEFAQLTKEEIDNKLADDDVIRQGELLDTVRQVGITNLNKLQKLNWNDPALRRLFMKPKIKAVEVSAAKVDPDIKNMVNEFLKTNVTENFVISRVLRENYAIFYSWLASHLQTERNAWTTRLAQALDQADQERKMSLKCRHLVVEVAARMRMLVRTSSSILFGIPDQQDEIFFKNDVIRRQDKNGKGRRGNSRNLWTEGGYASDGNSGLSRRGGALRYKKPLHDKKRNLVASNYRQVNVTDNEHEKATYDSDPCETMSDARINDENIIRKGPDAEHDHSRTPRKLNMSNDTKKSNIKKSTNIRTENSSVDGGELYSGYDLDGLIMEDDNFTDWNQVLSDNLDVLTDICDTLLVDRKACLQIVKANPQRCESLVDAVSAFAKRRNSDLNNKREIEKRLKILEKENQSLQDEMSVLHKTLADKNRDALNLQTQLDRLETMMKSYSAPKHNKCVGTSEEMFPAVFKNNLTVSCNKTPRQSNQHHLKHSKSPRSVDKEGKSKKLELPSINGQGNVKPSRQKLEYQNPALPVGESKDSDKRSSPDVPDDMHDKTHVLSPLEPNKMTREPSLIEISEEKLKTLKHRAKKLEDSLHDAIHSMERLNLSTQQIPSSLSSSNALSPLVPLYSKSKVNSERNGPKTFRRWQKASFEVNIKPLDNNGGQDVTSTPRVAVIKHSDSFSKQNDNKDLPEIRIPLNSESSSLLEGKSVMSAPRDASETTPAPSTSRLPSEKVQRLTTYSSNSNFDDSDEERSRHDNDGVYTYRRQTEANAPSQIQAPNARRMRARHNTSRLLGGKQTVSKCLRCHKLFSPTDNHKLACCYHTKEKERLEHYDQSGMLIRVMFAWKCCHEPQESEGCCYGQHV